jgi:GNAT superfamily N-acetyltransferase
LKEVKGDEIIISRVSAEKFHEFPAWSAAGFRDGGRAELLLETLARTAVLRADTSLYIATVAGRVAGSACMALIETTRGGVAHLYIDSTLPEYRGRGIQAALLGARLAAARKAGFDLASISARPGNGSCRNIERSGFSLAYTKTWCVKARK